jgi:hypothetical protein
MRHGFFLLHRLGIKNILSTCTELVEVLSKAGSQIKEALFHIAPVSTSST